MAVIAIDLGGTKIAVALFEADGKVHGKQTVNLQQRQGAEVGDLIRQEASKLLHMAVRQGLNMHAFGVCVPGISHFDTGRVWAPNIPGWDDYPLRDEMTAMTAGEIPVYMDSDRTCCILGETWRGAAQGCRNAIFLTVGTGIGAGIMVDGRVLRGAHDAAGAAGWLALNRPFDPKYASCGCFEYHASGEGIGKVAREYHPEKKENMTAREVFEAFASRDPVAQKVLDECVEFWGMATANLVSLFNPEKIIFGGGVFGPAVQFIDAIMAEARKWAQPVSINQVKLEASRLGGDAGLYGAARLALQGVSRDMWAEGHV
jgi:glucokinase